MLRELSPSELGTWAALYRLDPWGEMRADLRAGIGHALLANINRDSKQRPQPFSAADFMPYGEREEKDTAAEIGDSLMANLAAVGGKRETRKADWSRRRQAIKKAKNGNAR